MLTQKPLSTPDELPSFGLEGRVALITGASHGIGQAIAVAFARAGAQVALVSRSRDNLRETLEAVQSIGARVSAHEADVRFPDQLARLVDEVIAEWGTITILVNAAGLAYTREALTVSEQEWDLAIDTLLKGTFFTCQAVGARMKDEGYGKILNLSSTYAESVAPGKSVYAVAKAGVSHLTRALAVEWAPYGIRVNALAPTLTATRTREDLIRDEEALARVLQRIPMGRIAQPRDIIGAALFLASEASDFITGQTLYVDGGWNALG